MTKGGLIVKRFLTAITLVALLAPRVSTALARGGKGLDHLGDL
jgi:hypothetical protein